MKIIFIIATIFVSIRASAACTLPAGPLGLQKERFDADKKIILGCINGDLEFVALESRSTYSWISMGKVNASSSGSVDSVHIASRIILPNNLWVSISSTGKSISQGRMASLNLQEYAKIENGVVENIVSAKREASFPTNETWVATPYDPSSGSGRVRRGQHYRLGHFIPQDGPERLSK